MCIRDRLNTTITDSVNSKIDIKILNRLNKSQSESIIQMNLVDGIQYRSSYSFIYDNKKEPIWILNLPYYDDDNLNTYELDSFILILGGVYFFLLVITILFSYGISIYITRSLSEIGKKIQQTSLDKTNTKIQVNARTKEVNILVESYNKMVEKLNDSATDARINQSPPLINKKIPIAIAINDINKIRVKDSIYTLNKN